MARPPRSRKMPAVTRTVIEAPVSARPAIVGGLELVPVEAGSPASGMVASDGTVVAPSPSTGGLVDAGLTPLPDTVGTVDELPGTVLVVGTVVPPGAVVGTVGPVGRVVG